MYQYFVVTASGWGWMELGIKPLHLLITFMLIIPPQQSEDELEICIGIMRNWHDVPCCVTPSVTSIPSHSFKARGFKFGMHKPHINVSTLFIKWWNTCENKIQLIFDPEETTLKSIWTLIFRVKIFGPGSGRVSHLCLGLSQIFQFFPFG